MYVDNIVRKNISIHALVKRATCCVLTILALSVISIHALVKRATSFLRYIGIISSHFNPRPREEGDLVLDIA